MNQEVSWIWVSLLLWLQLVHHRFQWVVAVTVCVCGVEPGVREEFSKHLFFTLSVQLSLHTCTQSRSLSYSCPHPSDWRTGALTSVVCLSGHGLL